MRPANFLRCASAALALAVTIPVAAASGAGWEPDLEPALAKARQLGRDVLVDFTGSDWCGWCIKLDEEVFSKPAFKDYAAENLVLVSLDYPRRGGEAFNAMGPELRARNGRHAKRYGVQGYPTVLLMTPEGLVYGRTGYKSGGPGSYIEHLGQLRAGAERRTLAAQLELVRDPAADAAARMQAGYALLATNPRSALKGELVEVLRQLDPEDADLRIANAAIEQLSATHLSARDPAWTDVREALADAGQRVPSVQRVGRYHMLRGFAFAMTGEFDAADQSLARVRAVGDQTDASIAELEKLIRKRREGAGG